MAEKFRLKPQNELALLETMMRALAGEEAFISVEGDLSGRQLQEVPKIGGDQISSLKRQTRVPVLDFAVLPLRDESVLPIFQQIVRLGVTDSIVHIQI